MKLRLILLVLSLLAFLSASTGGYLYYSSIKEFAFKEAERQAVARVQTIKTFAVIPNEFTIEGGELTPTMKIKRKVVREKYAEQIEGLYTP